MIKFKSIYSDKTISIIKIKISYSSKISTSMIKYDMSSYKPLIMCSLLVIIVDLFIVYFYKVDFLYD